MKRTIDHADVIAVAVSLLLHATVLAICFRVADRTTARASRNSPPPVITSRLLIDEAPLPPAAGPRENAPEPRQPAPTARPQPSPERQEPALAELKPAAIIPPTIAPQELPEFPLNGFGELTGTADATALHSLDGDRPMQAPKADQDQPYISRDSSGDARIRGTPPRLPQQPAPRQNDLVPASSRDSDRQGAYSAASTRPAASAELIAMTPVKEAPQSAQEGETAAPPADEQKAGSPDAGASRASVADPAPMADSESDAFSVHGAAVFRPGKVSARFGRKVMTVRPRLSLAAHYDLLTLSNPDVVLLVRADETGKVREVSIKKSSGSKEVDQPCKLAMYEWWFEPPRDKAGRAKPCEMLWTIAFRTY